MIFIFYYFDCIFLSTHQGGPKIPQHDYGNTSIDLYQIERNSRCVCQYIELLNSVYILRGM